MQDVLHGTHNVSYILSHTVVFHFFFTQNGLLLIQG